MSGRTPSGLEPAIAERPEDPAEAREPDAYADAAGSGAGHADEDTGEITDARRARWTAAGAGGLLCLAGTAAALLRATGSAPAFVPAAYALGAAVCACAAVLGARGRTRRALWLLIAGTMIMALGDQFD